MLCSALLLFLGVSCEIEWALCQSRVEPVVQTEVAETPCSEGFLCNNQMCISPYWFCNNKDDCNDGSDEIQANGKIANVSGIVCRKHFDNRIDSSPKVCILPQSQASKSQLLCDIKPDCSEGFLCNNQKCLYPHDFCNGEDDCNDGSDEIPADGRNASGIICRQNYDDNLDSSPNLCILPQTQASKSELLCRIKPDCSDGFLCANQNCIFSRSFCNYYVDCSDGSDEILADGNLTNASGIPCRQHFDTGRSRPPKLCILPHSQASKSEKICKIKSDCSDGFFCDNQKCVPASSFCDGSNDCYDGSDEILADGKTNASGIACRQHFDTWRESSPNVCILPQSQLSKSQQICKIKTDCNGLVCDGGFCPSTNDFCGGDKKCGDTDAWDGQLSKRGDRFCSSIYSAFTCVLPQKHVCDASSYCKGGVDECLCGNGVSQVFLDEKCFRCLKDHMRVIPLGRLCDGIFDCSDLTDECLCDNGEKPILCDAVQWAEEQSVHPLSINCSDNVTTLEMEQICDDKNDCENKIDEKNCIRDSNLDTNPTKISDERGVSRYFCRDLRKYVTACDRVPECYEEVYEEECTLCPDQPRFCDYFEWDGYDWTMRCISGLPLSSRLICDDISICDENEDELDCGSWFYCKNGTSNRERITPDKVCDTVEDCSDGSDEGKHLNCPYFTCEDGGNVKYIGGRQVCDGTPDCAKGSDECQEKCIRSVFSDTESMIKNKGVVGFVWIICIAAVCGNIAVIVHTTHALIKQRNDNQVGKSAMVNKMLILNLSVSDLIVGIYTLAIVVQNTERERYCLVDQDWRSSSTCSAIGSLLVTGSQQSVFTMVIITVFRTLGITSKHKFEVSYRKFGIVIIATWIASVSLAVIPLMPSLEDYFIDSVWYKDNKLFTTINKGRVEDLTNWLSLMHENTNSCGIVSNIGSWATLEMLITELNPNLTVQRRFGFYSTHAVCLPTFFPNTKTDTAWWYSVLIISINFVSFVAVFVGSVIIYSAATAPSMALTKDVLQKRAAAMQAKLSRIVITDFCCWMPVCIMGFVQLSGFDIPYDAYIPIALIVIPINSSLNPFLYSNVPDKLWAKLKSLYVLKCGRPNTPGARANRIPSNRVTEVTSLRQQSRI